MRNHKVYMKIVVTSRNLFPSHQITTKVSSTFLPSLRRGGVTRFLDMSRWEKSSSPVPNILQMVYRKSPKSFMVIDQRFPSDQEPLKKALKMGVKVRGFVILTYKYSTSMPFSC